MYGSKIIKVYLFTYICNLLKCISIESRTNQWSEMEHTNYENQVYLLLLFIFITQTYIPLFLFLLLKLSTNMFNSVFNFYWPTNEWRLRWKSNLCQHFEWTFHLHLYRCIRARRAGPRSGTTVYNRTGLSMIILIRDATQIYPLSSERAELSLINQCGCLPLRRPRGLLVLVQTNNSLHLCRSSTC